MALHRLENVRTFLHGPPVTSGGHRLENGKRVLTRASGIAYKKQLPKHRRQRVENDTKFRARATVGVGLVPETRLLRLENGGYSCTGLR